MKFLSAVQTPPKDCIGAEAALKYLAGYVRGTVIGNARILSDSGGFVTFSYKDYRNGGALATETVSGQEFVRRLLIHVLPAGYRSFRHRGFLCNQKRTESIACIRRQLGVECRQQEEPKQADTRGDVDPFEPELQSPRCPRCGAERMTWVGGLPPKVGWIARCYGHFARDVRGAGFGTSPRPP